MTTFDVLVELYSIAAEPWGSHRWFRMAPPTESGLHGATEFG